MAFYNSASRLQFIGNSRLEEVIAEDERQLAEIKGSFEAIADRMRYFRDLIFYVEGNQCFSRSELSVGGYHLQDISYQEGVQECPFSDCNVRGTRDVMVTNTESGRQLVVNDITVHLVKEHNLLEKGNWFGISALDFYQHFMK